MSDRKPNVFKDVTIVHDGPRLEDEPDTLPKASKDSASACPYWSDKVHCYTTWGTREKVCRCGSRVGQREG